MFKLNDWIRFEGNTVVQIHNNVDMWNSISHIEHWQPKPNEWCWFYNGNETLEDLILAEFTHMKNDCYCGHTIDGKKLIDYLYCQPFVGQLPSFI